MELCEALPRLVCFFRPQVRKGLFDLDYFPVLVVWAIWSERHSNVFNCCCTCNKHVIPDNFFLAIFSSQSHVWCYDWAWHITTAAIAKFVFALFLGSRACWRNLFAFFVRNWGLHPDLCQLVQLVQLDQRLPRLNMDVVPCCTLQNHAPSLTWNKVEICWN